VTIIAAIIAFNEEQLLPGCLESVQDQVDRMVVVDGAYARFPHEAPWSTDATREIAWCYGAEWVPVPRGTDGQPRAWHTQMEKRTAYLVGEEGDWYLHIDADERLVGTLPPRGEGQHYAFQIHTRDMRLTWVPRLWQHRGRMRYEGSHNALWSDDQLITLQGAVKVPWEQCHFLHLSHLRSVQRQLDKRAFLPGRYERERAYRQLHSI
jgi:hypothetical protein